MAFVARQVPHSTFAHWQREARLTTAPVAFARVALGSAITPGRERGPECRDAIRLVVRSVAGHEAVLHGVDAATTLRFVAAVEPRLPVGPPHGTDPVDDLLHVPGAPMCTSLAIMSLEDR